ncbi:MAG: helix-turn-helix domain-containing protein, partial [Ruminococcus sp.]
FSEICKSLPKPQEITPERKRLIDCGEEKLKEYGKTFEEFFRAVEESDFLSGRSGKWTGCSFDWILKPLNMVKILEGNYTNQEGVSTFRGFSGGKNVSYDIDEYESSSTIDNWY